MYCGQPNLQVNYFGKLERTADYFSAGFYENFRDISKAYTMFILEAQRTAVKTFLNVDAILKGEYFHYKNNCGYGLSTRMLLKWYNTTDDSTTLDQKIERQRAKNPCEEGELPYFYRKWKCKSLIDAIRMTMCLPTANLDGRVESVQLCSQQNVAGCECNMLLPLTEDSMCQCIRNFPDSLMVYAQTAFDNPVLSKFHKP